MNSFLYLQKVISLLYRWDDFSDEVYAEMCEENLDFPRELGEKFYKLREETTQLLDEDKR